jgi:hypothetical protein
MGYAKAGTLQVFPKCLHFVLALNDDRLTAWVRSVEQQSFVNDLGAYQMIEVK